MSTSFGRSAIVLFVALFIGCDRIPENNPLKQAWKRAVEPPDARFEIFKSQSFDFLQKGAAITASSSQGVDVDSFGERLIAFRASYDVLKGIWPPDFASGAQRNIDLAIEGWDIALMHFRDKHLERIYEGTVEWKAVAAITNNGQGLAPFIERAESGDLEGRRYISATKGAMGVLLSWAATHFDTGKAIMLDALAGGR